MERRRDAESKSDFEAKKYFVFILMIIKGNNPGNIRKNPKSKWQGEIPGPGDFVTFDSLVNGYRAQIKLLSNYVKAGHDTINKIVTRWAPPSDNNPTEDYVKFVSLK